MSPKPMPDVQAMTLRLSNGHTVTLLIFVEYIQVSPSWIRCPAWTCRLESTGEKLFHTWTEDSAQQQAERWLEGYQRSYEDTKEPQS